MRAHWIFVAAALVLAPGCSASKFAPVSGKVTMNGKPLANATVAFNPIPAEGSIESGPTSVGTTNQSGEFTLRATLKQTGAMVGKHRVTISAMSSQPAVEGDGPVAPSSAPR